MVKDFQEELFQYIQSRMSGSNELDRICFTKPSKRYILGSLATRSPKKTEPDKDNPQSISDFERGSIRARQMRVSILVNKSDLMMDRRYSIDVLGSVYYRVKADPFLAMDIIEEEDEDNEIEQKAWKRMDFCIPCDIISSFHSGIKETTVDANFADVRRNINEDPSIDTQIPSSVWKAKISVTYSAYSGDQVLLNFYLTNMDNEVREKNQFERTLFNCSMIVRIGNLNSISFCDSYLYSGFAQRYYYDFRTINCQASWKDKNNGIFMTSNYASFIQSNIVPKNSLPGVDLSFSKLCSKNCIQELEKIQKSLEDASEKYNSNLIKAGNDFNTRIGAREFSIPEKNSYIKQFGEMVNLYERGLVALKSNEKAIESFLRMNQVLKEYYENKLGQDITKKELPSWRLFQIVFIVISLRSIVNQEDLDKVDILHVSTGGGKSEAYFGLTVFSLFFERLNGKKSGVTALVKFPLRMLSVQQLERLSSVIIYAEKIRKENDKTFPGSEFSLGYYVGSLDDDFPDYYYKQKKKLYDDADFKKVTIPAPQSKIIARCPLCSEPERGVVRLIDDVKKQRILHVCDKDPSHVFFIFLSDREIFRNRPSVIVSTVDKWAGLSSQRRARALLGCKGSQCSKGHGFIPSGDKCEDNADEDKYGKFHCEELGKPFQDGWGPILSIQDELHLLKEGFGTISSHFEGLIEQIVSSNSKGRKLKHIAMSATLNGVSGQIKELYNKDTIIIPGQSPDELDGNPGFFFERRENPKRVVYGMKPNLRDNHYASLRTILHTVEFLQIEQKRLVDTGDQFLSEYGLKNSNEAFQLFKNHMTPLTYHLKKQDAEDMHRYTEAVINDSLKRKFHSRVTGTVLTGERGLDELKSTIDKVREISSNYDIEKQLGPNSDYNPIFATSVVSHGVDLEELNLMIFQGIPHSTSEYIQALSRVGRRFKGLVIVWFYPNRVRDDSFYRNFNRYHDSLDHEVRPVPINRKSRLGMLQTINSIFCATIIQHISETANVPLIHKEDIKRLTLAQNQELVRFIKSVYGVPISINLDTEVELRLRQIKISTSRDTDFFPNVLAQSGQTFYKNQTGMRGIQQKLVLELMNKDEWALKRLRGE